jgi:hypothetical protein
MPAAKLIHSSGRGCLAKGLFSVLLLAILLSSLASAGCGRWVVRETTDYLADPLFDMTFPGAQEKANSTESNSTKIEQPENSTTTETKALPDLAGEWLVELNGSDRGRMELTLLQTGDRLRGYATLPGIGSEVHADGIGQLSSEKVNLDLKVIEKTPGQEADHYLLNLSLVNQTLSGLYEMRTGSGIEERGRATASRISG